MKICVVQDQKFRFHQAYKLVFTVFFVDYIYNVSGHVSLTFPPARDLSLDFLDTFRTPAPCGMPKQKSKISLIGGTNINITWHLGYPHQGGFYIDLLDEEEKVVQSLTPGNGGSKNDGWIDDDTTAQSYQLTVPSNLECINCTIRLQRQALEWGNGTNSGPVRMSILYPKTCQILPIIYVLEVEIIIPRHIQNPIHASQKIAILVVFDTISRLEQ